MKVILKKNLIVLILIFSLTLQLTSCIKGKIEYMHDKSEIKCIEIVDAAYDYYEDRPGQHLIYPIDNIQEFLNELDKITTTFYIIGGYPFAAERSRLVDSLGAREIFIDTDKEECIRRLYACEDRDKDEWLQYINNWWAQYEGTF